MANYNTFVVVDCNTSHILLVTSSARLANTYLRTGIRVEVWNGNRRTEKIYEHSKRREPDPLGPYIEMERDYIRKKQARSHKSNNRKGGKSNEVT